MKWLAVLVPCGVVWYLIARWRQPFADVRPPYRHYFPMPTTSTPLRKVWDGDQWIVLNDEEELRGVRTP